MGRAVALPTETAQRPNRFSLPAAVSGHVNLPPLLPFGFFRPVCSMPQSVSVGCSSFGTHLQYPATCIHVEPRHFVASCSSSRILSTSFACTISSSGANSPPAVEHQRKPPTTATWIVRASRPCVSSRTRGSCRPKFWIADTRDWVGHEIMRLVSGGRMVRSRSMSTPVGRDSPAPSNSYPAKVPRYLGFRTGTNFMCLVLHPGDEPPLLIPQLASQLRQPISSKSYMVMLKCISQSNALPKPRHLTVYTPVETAWYPFLPTFSVNSLLHPSPRPSLATTRSNVHSGSQNSSLTALAES